MSRIEADPLDPRVGFARLLAGVPILRKQYQALRATLPDSPVQILGLFGAWRGGKTTGEMLAALSSGVQNPYIDDYGGNRPCTLMVTETTTVLRDAMYAALMEVFPEGLVIREVKHPAWDLELPNGHVYALRTALGALEGKTVCTTIVDEIHKVRTKRDYLNYSARASDKRAAKNLTIVAGLPIDNGWLREEFDRKDNDPTRMAVYMRTDENVHLPPGYAARLRSSCSAKEAKTLLDAEWHVYEGAIYDDYDSTRHLVDDAGRSNELVHIGLDAGHQAALVVAQDRRRTWRDGTSDDGLHIVDELLPDSTSVEQAMRAFYRRGWRLWPGRSYVCVDPRIDIDQLESIKRVLAENGGAGVEIVQRSRGELAEAVEYGIRCVQHALLDAAGNVRLTFARSLPESERGLRRALAKYRWDPRTRRPVKDDKIDHVLDALRYVVAQRLPTAAAELDVADGPFGRR